MYQKLVVNKSVNIKLVSFLLVLFMLSIPFTRIFSGANLIFFTMILSFVVVRLNLYSGYSWIFNSFLVLSGFYVVLSFLQILPSAWTQMFSYSALIQQTLYVYSMPFFMFSSVYLLRYYLARPIAIKELALGTFLCWFAAKFFYAIIYGEGFGSITNFFSYHFAIQGMGSLTSMIILSANLYLLINDSTFKKYLILAVFLFCSWLSPFGQNLVFGLVFAAIWVLPRFSWYTLISFMLIVIVVYIVAYPDPNVLRVVDPNLAVRLVFLRDAISGFIGSYGLGVGFGTESIVNYYPEYFNDPVFMDSNLPGFINLAHHNSFFTLLFRLGVFAVLFYLFVLKIFFQIRRLSDNKLKAFASSAFLAFFVVTFLNPALESFEYLYGVAIYIAMILVLTSKSKFRSLAMHVQSINPANVVKPT